MEISDVVDNGDDLPKRYGKFNYVVIYPTGTIRRISDERDYNDIEFVKLDDKRYEIRRLHHTHSTSHSPRYYYKYGGEYHISDKEIKRAPVALEDRIKYHARSELDKPVM